MKIPFVGNSPIRKNMIANLFGVGVQLMNQVVLVPFYILFWGNKQYSDWIVISALTVIFSMSDVGLNNVIQNRFAISLAEGNTRECKSLITDNYLLVALTLILALAIGLAFEASWDITKTMGLHLLTRTEANIVFLILLVKVFVGMFSGIENSIYRAVHKAGWCVYMDQFANLCVAIITLLCILLKFSVVMLCVFITVPQLFVWIYKYFHSQRHFVHTLSHYTVDIPLLKSLVVPSLTFMAFPAGNAVVLQGYTLVVNTFFGADLVVLYNTTRTLCNFVKTFLATLQGAVWPEYSIAYGNEDYTMMRHLHRKIIKITVFAAACMGVGLILLGPLIYRIWTHDAVLFSYSLMVTYVLAIFMESLWTSSAVTLMATNNHSKLGILYVIVSSFCLGFSVYIAHTYASLWAVASTLILMHFIVCIYTVRAGFKLTGDRLFYR